MTLSIPQPRFTLGQPVEPSCEIRQRDDWHDAKLIITAIAYCRQTRFVTYTVHEEEELKERQFYGPGGSDGWDEADLSPRDVSGATP